MTVWMQEEILIISEYLPELSTLMSASQILYEDQVKYISSSAGHLGLQAQTHIFISWSFCFFLSRK